jgi:uroporphyrinogen decarboxylase
MHKRDVVRMALRHERPPYVPWSLGFTQQAAARLKAHFGTDELEPHLRNHIAWIGNGTGFQDLGDGRVRDSFGVTWDRSVDEDIGVVQDCLLPEPTLADYGFPDPLALLEGLPGRVEAAGTRFRMFAIGFSLYERAWTLRGMENLLMDFHVNPEFVHELLGAITEWNLAQVRRAVELDIDAVYFGDDWGQQHGLQMGPAIWREFIRPHLERMYGAVKDAGKFVVIHSCGDVQEVLDDLVEIGLDCFNPFQPEVMDVQGVFNRYRGRLAFYGGLSTQRTLPYGTPADVRGETRHLLAMGRDGGYIFSPAHAVEGDVPLENMLAFIEEVHAQAPAG